MIATDWWRDFFSGVAVEFWLKCTTEEQTRAEVDFLEKALRLTPKTQMLDEDGTIWKVTHDMVERLPPGAKVLDVPCGGGRHSLELAARGYGVTGVDLSSDFLTAARTQAAARQLSVVWEQREMIDLPWQAEFDGAFCLGNSFGYLDDAGNASFFKAVARTLKPKARFVLETGYVTECLFPAFHERRWMQVGDILFLSQGRYDPIHGRLDTEYTFIREGHTDTRMASTRIYSYRELCKLLADAGFTDCTGFGSLQQEAFRLGSPRLLLVASRG